jgi:alpha-galactosidase
MRQVKIVLIGAGSYGFGPAMLYDLMEGSELTGQLMLVDVDPARLARMTRVAQRMNQTWGERFEVLSTTDRREALPGATIVVAATERKRFEMWRLDIEIPLKHGVKPALGENGGPGGLFHTLRQVPVTLSIAQDMEQLCPDAWFINMSNPESRLCLAVHRYTRIKSVGVCQAAYITRYRMATILGLPPDDVDVKAAGINHFHWVLDIRHARSGEDLYPQFRNKLAATDSSYEPLSRECLRRFGLYPGPADNHVSEYLSWGWQYLPASYTDRVFHPPELTSGRGKALEAIAAGDGPLADIELELFRRGSVSWQTLDIIRSLIDNGNRYILSVNIPNDGYIPNMTSGAIVEIPAIIGADRIYGLRTAALPPAIAALAELQVRIMDLAVEAAVTGDRQTALEALIIDPLVPDPQTAEKILDEMLVLQAELLPQFQ